jgi:hypothetical protein
VVRQHAAGERACGRHDLPFSESPKLEVLELPKNLANFEKES